MTKELYSDELAHVGVGWDDNPPGRGSGRYPHGSGERPNQHIEFYERVLAARKEGLTEAEIQEKFQMNSSVYRAALSVGKEAREKVLAVKAHELANAVDDNGKRLYSNVEIGKMLDVTEGTVRNYLKKPVEGKSSKLAEVMENLKSQMADGRFLDVGTGSQYALGCSEQMMKNAARLLSEQEGYELYSEIRVKQQGTNHSTTMKVLTPPGTIKKDVYDDLGNIKMIEGNTEMWPDGNKNVTLFGLKPPTSVDASRVMVRYAEDGGKEKDGVIELRRGVEDLMIGKSSYAQVRIAVNGTHYLKGMAVYGEDQEFPPGVDIIFNTNKHTGTPMLGKKDDTVLKVLKDDPKNPFGATIDKQIEFKDKNGKIILSPVNIVNEEGSWGGEEGWSKNIASQMLGKQPTPLIKKQLKLSYADRVADFDEIMALENPVIKRELLSAFADNCDRAAVDLKASPFPGQSWKVILPIPSLKDNEIYAPTYNDGDHVVLVRYPHQGTHEIPELVVNNKNCKEGQIILGQAVDAVGINANVANRLSGADFDGDTVMVIPANGPNSKVKITTKEPFAGLDAFDPKEEYARPKGTKDETGNYILDENGKRIMRLLKDGAPKQSEMGQISNLITDMTLKGAPNDDLARAIRHAQVIIDAPKHELNYKLSEEVNGIAELKKKWQEKYDENGQVKYGGASTLLSRAKGVYYIPEREEGKYITDPVTGKKKRQYINPDTGEKEYNYTNRTKREAMVDPNHPWVTDENGKYVLDKKGKKQKNYILDENGKKVYYDSGAPVTIKSTQMYETKDAHKLSSGTLTEEIYADYANKLKALANEARKAQISVKPMKQNVEAKKEYAEEVKSLNYKLMLSLKNAPRERQAQILAGLTMKAHKENNPDMTAEEEKKYRNQALSGAREIVGASKYRFNGLVSGAEEGKTRQKKGLEITEKEWKAIQSGAISDAMFSKIVANSDLNYIRRLASPRTTKSLSLAKINKIKAMSSSGYSLSEIANLMNLSSTTVSKYLKGEK